MFALLAVLFLVVPIVELYVIVQVAQGFGILPTLALLVLVSVVGASLLRSQGLGVLRRVNEALAAGRMPGRELVDGVLVVIGGALMLTPGFVTDAVGLALLLPPTRALVRLALVRRWRHRITVVSSMGGVGDGMGWPGPGTARRVDVEVVDVEVVEDGPGDEGGPVGWDGALPPGS